MKCNYTPSDRASLVITSQWSVIIHPAIVPLLQSSIFNSCCNFDQRLLWTFKTNHQSRNSADGCLFHNIHFCANVYKQCVGGISASVVAHPLSPHYYELLLIITCKHEHQNTWIEFIAGRKGRKQKFLLSHTSSHIAQLRAKFVLATDYGN